MFWFLLWEKMHENKVQNKTYTIRMRERALSQMGRGPREGARRVEEREGMRKGIVMCFVHAPAPHKKSEHYVMQTSTSKNKQ